MLLKTVVDTPKRFALSGRILHCWSIFATNALTCYLLSRQSPLYLQETAGAHNWQKWIDGLLTSPSQGYKWIESANLQGLDVSVQMQANGSNINRHQYTVYWHHNMRSPLAVCTHTIVCSALDGCHKQGCRIPFMDGTFAQPVKRQIDPDMATKFSRTRQSTGQGGINARDIECNTKFHTKLWTPRMQLD